MHFKVLYTVQALNIYYIPEFVKWLLDMNLPRIADYKSEKNIDDIIHTGILHYPQYLSPKVFPPRVKRQITRKLENFILDYGDRINLNSVKGLCALMNEEDHSHLLNQFNDYLENIDELRKLNRKEAFKELDEMGIFKPARREV